MNKKALTFVISFVILAFTVKAQVWSYKQKVLPETWQNNFHEEYGESSDIDGDYAVIGAAGHDANRGCAYVLFHNGTSWETLGKLTASDSESNDHFGKSVSISGDVIAVGAWENENNNAQYSGAVYVFEKPVGGWANMTETAKLTASDADINLRLGYSVSISGNTIVAGTRNKNNNAGAAYVFEKPTGGWVDATENAILTSSLPSSGDNFANDLAVSNNVILIGAPYDDGGGVAYIFEKENSQWTQTAAFTGSYYASGNFGISVDIAGDIAVVGDSENQYAFIFNKPAGGWSDWDGTTAQDDYISPAGGLALSFAGSVSVSGDLIVVGDHEVNTGVGQAFVYVKDPTTGWDFTETVKLTASDGTESDYFGQSIAASGDKVLIGATGEDSNSENSGAVYAFEKPGTAGGWADAGAEDQKIKPLSYPNNHEERYGNAVAIDGNYAVVGASNYNGGTGAAYVLFYNGVTWSTEGRLQASDTHAEQVFGHSVAIHGDTIVIGSKDNQNGDNSGAAYVFIKPGTGWIDMTEDAKLTASDGVAGDQLSYVSISANVIAVGAPDHNTDGAVYVFEKPGTGWDNMTETIKLTASDAGGSSVFNFGGHVSINSNTIAVGTSGGSNGSTVSGAVYVFEKPGDNWTSIPETAKLTPSDAVDLGYFGRALDLGNDVILVGADNDNTGNNTGGVAYVFEKPSGGWVDMTETAKLTSSDGESGDEFANNLTISDSHAVVAAYRDDETQDMSGSVYIYDTPASGWVSSTEDKKITNPDPGYTDSFGTAVDISGNFFITGSYLDDTSNGRNSGSAFIYESLPHQPIAFIQHPSDKAEVCVGDDVIYEVEGENMTEYHWQVSTDDGTSFTDLDDGELYTGTQTSQLTLSAIPSLDGNLYRCALSNPDYSAESNSAAFLIETENPQITSSYNNETLDADQNCEAVLPDYASTASVSDNCDSNPEVSQNPVAGTTVSGAVNSVTLTVTDNAGNISETTFNVEVTDNIKPEITSVHDDVTVDANADCQAVLPDYTGDVSADDNCSTDFNISQIPAAGTTINGTNNELTLRVEDQAGNFAETVFNVSVVDNTDPEISCVGDQTIVIEENQTSFTVSGSDLDPDYSDNCGVSGILNDYNNINSLSGAILPLGETSITWTLTDNAGNVSVCSDVITVSHTTRINSMDETAVAVFPNPTDGLFVLEFDRACTAEITELSGRVIKTFKHTGGTTTIDLTGETRGLYFIRLIKDSNTSVVKLIKE